MDDKPVCATRKDLAQHARDHYEEISAASMWWSSIIPKAIDAWEREPDLQATADRRLELLRELYNFKERENRGDPDYIPSEWWQDIVWERVRKELSDEV